MSKAEKKQPLRLLIESILSLLQGHTLHEGSLKHSQRFPVCCH